MDAVGGDFDFGNAAEGKQKLYEVLGRLFRSLFHNVGNGVGNRGLEHHTFGLQAGKVHAYELARLQHDFYTKILPPRVVKCKPSPMIPSGGSRQSIFNDAFWAAGLFLRFGRTKDPPLQRQKQRARTRRRGHTAPFDELEPKGRRHP